MNLSYFISKRIIREQKGGFTATIHRIAIASISVGLAAAIVSFLVMKGFQNTVKEKIYGFSGHVIVKKYTMDNSPEELRPINKFINLYTTPAAFPYVSHVQEFAHKAGLVKTEDEVLGVVVKGVGKNFNVKAFNENLVEGTFIEFPDSTYANQVVISKAIAQKIKAKVGDAIMVHFFQNPPRYRKLKVTGIYETNLSEYFDSRVVISDIRMIQRLNDWSDSLVGGFEVALNMNYFSKNELKLEQSDEILYEDEAGINKFLAIASTWLFFDYPVAVLNKSVQQIGESMDFDLRIESVNKTYSQVFEWLNLLSRQVNILLGIILTVISVNMISIVLILVMERTQMIGMLKALGAQNRLIRSVFVYNGVLLIVKGLFFGNLLGLGVCFIQHKFKIFKLNPQDYYMDVVPISWNWDIVLLLNLITFIIVTMVLLLPTMVISRVHPIKAIRFD